MTANEIVKAALRKINVYASGETPETVDLTDGLQALQVMLRSWAGRNLLVFHTTKESLALISGTAVYTWGVGASYSINSAPPNLVTGGYVVDSGGGSHNLDIITSSRYNKISNKSLASRPFCASVDYTYPVASITFYPVPVDVETTYLECVKPFTETSSFDTGESVLAFPPRYEEAIIYNLAIRLGPEYGKEVSELVLVIARDAMNSIAQFNAASRVDFVSITVPAGPRSMTYNINTDSSR